jgi:potassium voltage-gated channel Eag-related subfamily H protein 8
MDTGPINEEEIALVLSRCKSSSCPGPVDQIPYIVLKKYPSLLTALCHIFNWCWMQKRVPAAWKVGVLRLLGKKKAEEDPSVPKNFRPIALTSCIGKVFTSVLKHRWMTYMTGNSYLNTSVQKAFVDGIPGCTEHHVKLLSILNEAHRKHKSLCVCWLDLSNAFGSVHHSLIRFSFQHYHAPPEMVDMMAAFYENLIGIVSSKSWQSQPLHLQIGVFQGDPLSVLVFNTVMNTLVDTITKQYSSLGYALGASSQRSSLLQYANDTTLLADGPSSCQRLLSTIEAWLVWSGMRANVPKCMCLAIQASSAKSYDPKLTLNGETIPYIGNSTFRFLGAPVTISGTGTQTRDDLVLKLTSLLEKVDSTLLTRQQKLRLYQLAICPRLTWDMSVNSFPVSWLKNSLQTIVTRFLKKWCGLARSADTGCIYLPKEKGGLELTSLVTLYKKLQVSKAATYMCSRDPVVRAIAGQETRKEASQQRPTFKPYQIVVKVMKEDPGASARKVRNQAKSTVEEEETVARLSHSTSLVRQNQPLSDDSRAPLLWSSTVTTLPERVFKFALNSLTDTLPHNSNLHLWKKITSPACNLCGQRQTLLHVLNACPYALEKRRYNDRHDAILESIHAYLAKQLPSSQNVMADLPNQQYSFPQQIACTDTRPDIVVWDETSITIMELTVPFELSIDTAVTRKRSRYSELLNTCKARGYAANLLTVEVGSRGFVHATSFDSLFSVFPANRSEREMLERDVVRKSIEQSYKIWCKRNWREANTT